MTTLVNIAIVGDRDDSIAAHLAIPLALANAASALDVDLVFEWLASDSIDDVARLAAFDGFWVAPGSPYRSLDGVLRAIGHARTAGRPFLGTCGGFQHAILEFARHVLDWPDAMHAESDPGVGRPVIVALECSLVEARGSVTLAPNSRIARAYAASTAPTIYRCRYGLNPDFRAALVSGPLRCTAQDENGDLRAIELDDHPFFVATLWQPERAALEGQRVPLAEALVDAARRA
ncbi:MAG: glutamine amidotransferase-related protein [Vitreoscilla sp.]